jgi:dTDP-4-amino-4,6-dideoxygalactose transaminase
MDKLAILGGRKIRQKPFATAPRMGREERARVSKVLKSGILSGFVAKSGDNFLGGPQVKELESLLHGYFQVKLAVAVNSATSALHAAVGACGIGPGDEVIVTPYTMSASATSIVMQNAIPVFADIDENNFCIDPRRIEEKINSRTKAIIAVHLFGYPADMKQIMDIAKKHNLYVIEDCAQAPGAVYKNKLVGTISDIGIFSFNQHKTITSGEGGFAVTNNERLALRMQLIRNHAEAITADMGLQDLDNLVGFNYRMTELEAAVSIGQFKQLDFLNNYRIELAEYLTHKLSVFKALTLPKKEVGNKHVYFVYPIRLKEQEAGISRDMLVKALNAEGIPFGAGYVRPLYLEPLYQKKIAYGKNGCPFTCGFYNGDIDYSKGICPVAERMYEKELLMTGVCRYPQTKKDMDDIAGAFEKIFQNREELRNIVL